MSAIDILGIIGELLSWIGAIIGIPFLAAALIFRSRDGTRQPVSVTIIEDLEQQMVALWTVEGHTFSRPLSAQDQLPRNHSSTGTGYISPRHSGRLEFQKRSHAERLCTALAITMLGTAAVGFIASLAPIFW